MLLVTRSCCQLLWLDHPHQDLSVSSYTLLNGELLTLTLTSRGWNPASGWQHELPAPVRPGSSAQHLLPSLHVLC